MNIPSSIADLLKPEVLSAIEAQLAPAEDRRATKNVEVEVEVDGQGTFTLSYAAKKLSGKKGFAKKALLSAKVSKTAWLLLRDELQAAVDGFPGAPEIEKRAAMFRTTATAALLDAGIAAVEKMAEGAAISFDIKGEGVVVIARGSVDEATKEMKIVLQGPQIRGLLKGAPLTSATAAISGDRSVGATVLTAMTPLLKQLQLK